MPGSTWSLYIIECGDGTLYTGIATDVGRRLAEHAGGTRGAKYLRSRAPYKLAFEQAVGDRGKALRLEARVKKLPRRSKLDLIAGRLALESLGAAAQVPVEASPA